MPDIPVTHPSIPYPMRRAAGRLRPGDVVVARWPWPGSMTLEGYAPWPCILLRVRAHGPDPAMQLAPCMPAIERPPRGPDLAREPHDMRDVPGIAGAVTVVLGRGLDVPLAHPALIWGPAGPTLLGRIAGDARVCLDALVRQLGEGLALMDPDESVRRLREGSPAGSAPGIRRPTSGPAAGGGGAAPVRPSSARPPAILASPRRPPRAGPGQRQEGWAMSGDRMSVDEFIRWSTAQPDRRRWELHDGRRMRRSGSWLPDRIAKMEMMVQLHVGLMHDARHQVSGMGPLVVAGPRTVERQPP